MRWKTLAAVTVALVSLAGCLGGNDDGTQAEPSPLEVYRFTYPGADTFVAGTEHGWLLRVANPSQETLLTTILPIGLEEATLGPVTMTAGVPQPVLLPQTVRGGQAVAPPALSLAPGDAGVFLVMVRAYADEGPVGVRVFAGVDSEPDRSFEAITLRWNVTRSEAATPVLPGDHVQTVTVGVWMNGTSFYTNSPDLLGDPDFPYPDNFDRSTDAALPLPVYVYEDSRTEQPAGSADTCHFTTITGYNGLLKEQAEGSTGVRLLRPEAGYTLEGNEGHLLYGDALIFLNAVVAHDGATGPADILPDPTAPCFDPEHALAPLDDVPATAR